MFTRLLSLIAVTMLTAAGLCQTKLDVNKKVEGWANVPGGTVWLRPDIDAYEHSTGLVRDMRTGQKYYPITPQSLQRQPQYQPQPAYQPYVQPVVVQPVPVAPSYPQPVYPQPYSPPTRQPIYPQPNPLYAPWVDVGPYGNGGCNNCGVLGSTGSITNRWAPIGAMPK